MRFRDRPLLADDFDAALYLERPELEAELVRPLLGGRNVLVLGEAGSGKSTLLRRAGGVLRQAGRAAVMVNAAVADDALELLELIDAELGEPGIVRRPEAAGSASSSVKLVTAARRLRRDPAAVILLDGLGDSDIGYDLFGRLRDELWELGHTWAVGVRPRDSAPLRTPPAEAFWGAIVQIPPLDRSETESLLRLGLDEREYELVGTGRPSSGAWPRSVIRWAQEALAGGGQAALSARDDLLRRAGELGRSEAMAVSELQGIGRPVSTHDPELLERLGWSRPYAQRILSHLEQNGLLRSIPERGEGPGRPRKLYELNPHPEHA